MMKNRAGRLIAFSCNSVGYSYPDMSPFTAAKAAVEAFIKCYSNEYAPQGISSTAIALPTMKTDEILAEKPDGDHENYIAPEELSGFIVRNVLSQPAIATGNVMRLINPSPTFYGLGYFERNPRKPEHNNAMHPTATVASAPSASGDG
jgi:NAD(P)-dependent dehydrogenase (short-subunit alcohol dehydrogenase family)